MLDTTVQIIDPFLFFLIFASFLIHVVSLFFKQPNKLASFSGLLIKLLRNEKYYMCLPSFKRVVSDIIKLAFGF